ncbi:amidase [Methylocystis sp.]|uniref:amidase n=1 Tax=Methylocystis sp. TaxID=1911079 RepID=UPI003D0CE9C3
MLLGDFTIAQAQDFFARGEGTSVALCQAYLERIAEIDRAGPNLRSVLELNPNALMTAEACDRARQNGAQLSPLNGIPILVKDSIDTADGTMTTAGSIAMIGNFATSDAFIVKRLREAGAVILGKANMTEWSYMRSARTCSGWSSRGGQIRNPHVLDRSPSGSSGGSAVAVAANLCMAALGAEVDGSIVRPSSANGVVGIKPTVGLVSRSGVMPVAEPQDTAGPIARTVTDVAIVLSALSGQDRADPATMAGEAAGSRDFSAFLKPDALRGARLGVARDMMGTHEAVDKVIDAAIDAMRDLGAEVIDPAIGAWTPFFGEAEVELCLYGFKAGINRYLASHPNSPMRSLAEVIAFNDAHADQVMPYFPQDLFERAQAKGGLGEEAYEKAKAECRRMSRSDGIDRVLRKYRLDALIAPTDGTPPWVVDPLVGDHIIGGCSAPPAMAGYPHVTVPAGMCYGLPVALSFFGDAWQDGKLLGYAFAFEQATQARRTPAFKPTVV